MEKEVAFLIEEDVAMWKKAALKGVKKGINFMYLWLQSIKDNKSNVYYILIYYKITTIILILYSSFIF